MRGIPNPGSILCSPGFERHTRIPGDVAQPSRFTTTRVVGIRILYMYPLESTELESDAVPEVSIAETTGRVSIGTSSNFAPLPFSHDSTHVSVVGQEASWKSVALKTSPGFERHTRIPGDVAKVLLFRF